MKRIFLILLVFVFIFPLAVFAQTKTDEAFKAVVTEVLEEKEVKVTETQIVLQQNLKLKGLSGDFKEKEIIFNGISLVEMVNNRVYKIGDKVLVIASSDENGNFQFYVTDHVRTSILWWLFLVFVVVLLIVGRNKGLASIISLMITFFVIIKFIVPKALAGGSILPTTLIGSFFILLVVIYLTEGFRPRAHISIVCTAITLIFTAVVSWVFVELAKLSGVTGEDVAHLANIGTGSINFKGLMFSGVIIGALGVMDDVIISQVTAVEQIYNTDKNQSMKTIFKKAYDIGVSHISSMTNTLFLAYAGVSMPLLVLFVSGTSAFESWGDILNNEAIATEIVRTLSGSIGLILAVPLSTFVAVWWFKNKN